MSHNTQPKEILIKSIHFPMNGFQHITKESIMDDFSFIVNGEEYECCKYIAEFISTNAFNNLQADSTSFCFELSTHYNGNFNDLLSLFYGNTITVTSLNYDYYVDISQKLGFADLLVELKVKDDELTFNNSITILNNSFDCEAAAHFIALHFTEYSVDDLKNISVEVLSLILEDKDLVIESEEYLFHVIERLILIDSAYECLLQYVFFENVSDEIIIQLLNDLPIERLLIEYGGIWKSLQQRLLCCRKDNRKHQYHEKTILPTPSSFSQQPPISAPRTPPPPPPPPPPPHPTSAPRPPIIIQSINELVSMANLRGRIVRNHVTSIDSSDSSSSDEW